MCLLSCNKYPLNGQSRLTVLSERTLCRMGDNVAIVLMLVELTNQSTRASKQNRKSWSSHCFQLMVLIYSLLPGSNSWIVQDCLTCKWFFSHLDTQPSSWMSKCISACSHECNLHFLERVFWTVTKLHYVFVQITLVLWSARNGRGSLDLRAWGPWSLG